METFAKKKMNVMLIVPELVLGGQERVAVNTASILAETYDITMVIFSNKDAVYRPECKVINIDIPPTESNLHRVINVFRRVLVLRRLKRRLHVDISISFGDTANLINVLSRTGDKIIVSVRGYGLLLKVSVNKIISKFTYKKADRIICVAEKMARDLVLLFKISPEKVFAVYNPYDPDSLNHQARQPIPLEIRHPAIVTMGRLEDVKGYKHLLRSFAYVNKELPQANLIFIGDGSLKEELQRLAAQLGLADKVVFLGFQANPFSYLAQCDLYVLSSIYEGFPNAMVEAMVCGLPVIAADCKSGPREILSETYNDHTTQGVAEADYGILTAPFSADNSNEPGLDMNFGQAILRLLQDDDMYRNYQEKSRQRARAFSLEEYRNKIMAVIED